MSLRLPFDLFRVGVGHWWKTHGHDALYVFDTTIGN